MRMATFLCLSFALSTMQVTAECDSAIQIIEGESQLIIKNISGKPIVAYALSSVTKSKDGSPIRTYSGIYSGADSLGPGQSLEIGKAGIAPRDLSVDHVRLSDGWRCGPKQPVRSEK